MNVIKISSKNEIREKVLSSGLTDIVTIESIGRGGQLEKRNGYIRRIDCLYGSTMTMTPIFYRGVKPYPVPIGNSLVLKNIDRVRGICIDAVISLDAICSIHDSGTKLEFKN